MDTDDGKHAIPEVITKHASIGRYRANRAEWVIYIEAIRSWAQELWDSAERFLKDTTELHCVLYDKVMLTIFQHWIMRRLLMEIAD